MKKSDFFERRLKTRKKSLEEMLKSAERMDKNFNIGVFILVSIAIISLFYYNIKNTNEEYVYVLNCFAKESIYTKAEYSEYDIWEDEWDSWSEQITETFEVETKNKSITSANNNNTYKNQYGYFSSKKQIIEDSEIYRSDSKFDNFNEFNIVDIKIEFEDGRILKTKNPQDYIKCINRYDDEKPVKVKTFKGFVTEFI